MFLYLLFYRYKAVYQNLEELKVWFLPNIQQSKICPQILQYHSPADWSQMICGLLSTILVGANFNSYAAKVGASMLNIAQVLADAERGVVLDIPQTGKLSRPWAVGLTTGNEEECDNVFIEYVSNQVQIVS